ncbi:MAG: Ig-like domain-containing protein [Armatimonadetes bacterium]|nr:Ig-like domain-containing protein [Armatimonadota bacterium]
MDFLRRLYRVCARLAFPALLWSIGLLWVASAALQAADPQAVSIEPLSAGVATGEKTTFVTTYSDADGAGNLAGVFLLINTSVSGAQGVYLYYDINRNRLFLRDDTNSAWLGGYARGAQMTVQNSQCTLYCADTTARSIGNDVIVNWRLEFKHSLSGRKCGGWLFAADDDGRSSGWMRRGTYVFGRAPLNASLTPPTGPVTPEAYSVFTASYVDGDGADDMSGCYLLINTELSGANAIYLLYTPADNRLYLRNDANTAWLGGVAPGQSVFLDNSQARVDVAGTSVTKSAGTVSIKWRVLPKATMTGSSVGAWLYVSDKTALIDGWDRFASYSISRAPTNQFFAPSSGVLDVNTPLTLTSRYADADGADNIWTCYVLLSASGTGQSSIYLYYDANADRLYLRNSANTAWLGGVSPGSANPVENDQCTLYPAETTVARSGSILTVNWRVLIKPALSGQNLSPMLYVTDDTRLAAGWDSFGSLSVGQPVSVSRITMAPENLVLNVGDSYVLRAGLLDVYGQVVSSRSSPVWATSSASRVSVSPQSLDDTREFQTARLQGVATGQANVSATSGSVSGATAVKVMDLSALGKLVENADWFPDQTLSNGYYVDYYFYTTPGTIYRAYLQTSQGSVDALLSNDPAFASSSGTVRVNSGQTKTWGFTAGSGYGTYFIRVTGRSSSSAFDLWLDSGQNDYRYPVPGHYLSLEPNGQTIFRRVGDGESSLYRFEGVGGQLYDLRIDADADVTVTGSQNQTVAHRTVSAGSDNHVSFTSSASQSYFVAVSHTGDSQVGEAVRLMQPSRPDIRGGQMALLPSRSALLPGESETLRLAMVDSSWLPAPEPAFVTWTAGGDRLSFASGGSVGGYVTASAQADSPGPARSYGQIATRHTSSAAQSFALVDLLGQGEAERLNLNAPATVTLANGGEKGYTLAVTAGTKYTITASAIAGEADVELSSDPNFWNSLGFSHITSSSSYDFSFIAPGRIGVVYIRVSGTQVSNRVSVSASAQSDTYLYPVQSTMSRISLNGSALSAKLGRWDLGRGLDEEAAWFYFDIPNTGINYSLQLHSDSGAIDWEVADNYGFQSRLFSDHTVEGTTGAYNFVPPRAPARYYVRVRGRSLINRFTLTFRT